jgi:tetratricopeptide (TPR) repeat protein
MSKFDDAIKCIDRAINLDPMHAAFWYNKGICQDRMGHLDRAIKSFEKAIELRPRYPEAWFNKAIALETKGDKSAAIDAWKSYLNIAAKNRNQSEWKIMAIDRLSKLKGEGK